MRVDLCPATVSPNPGESFCRFDLAVYSSILALGALQYFFFLHAPDSAYDATFIELARSILEKHSYQFDFRPETLYPPGLPLILATVFVAVGYGQAVLFHLMAISTTVALIASYELLRRIENRKFAAAACLVLGSSPALFAFTTQIVLSDMPYFAASMIALLIAYEIGYDQRVSQARGTLALSAALVACLMLRSSGIPLLLGLIPCAVRAFRKERTFVPHKWRLFLIPFLVALGTQALWSTWAGQHQFTEWPLPGWPQSYLSQLKVKDGNDPELGMAGLSDIPIRIKNNLANRSVELVKLATRRTWISPEWPSPAVFGVVALILTGLAASFWKDGGQLHDWYFLGYEAMYALWPWDFEMRFLLPIVPLAFLYLWRGGKLIRQFSKSQPQKCGLALAGTALILIGASLKWFIHTGSAQSLGAALFWGLLLAAGSFLMVKPRLNLPGAAWVPKLYWKPTAAFRVAALCAIALITATGIMAQLRLADHNLSFDMRRGTFYGDIEAAKWIRTHEPTQFVVMARKEDLVYHYSQHQVIWFPPTTNPAILRDGIRKYNVRLIVVVDRNDSYWRPPEDVCFQALLQAHHQEFRLVHRGPHNRIFEVQQDGSTANIVS